MSIIYDVYLQDLENKLQPLTWRQRIHSVNRLYEKIRLIHNAVGSCGMWSWIDDDNIVRYKVPTMTIQQFNQQYPNVSQKLRPLLLPYIEGDYLNEKGWKVFLNKAFNPRHDVICHIRSLLVKQMRNFSNAIKNQLIAEGIITENINLNDPELKSYLDNKTTLRNLIAEHEFEPVE